MLHAFTADQILLGDVTKAGQRHGVEITGVAKTIKLNLHRPLCSQTSLLSISTKMVMSRPLPNMKGLAITTLAMKQKPASMSVTRLLNRLPQLCVLDESDRVHKPCCSTSACSCSGGKDKCKHGSKMPPESCCSTAALLHPAPDSTSRSTAGRRGPPRVLQEQRWLQPQRCHVPNFVGGYLGQVKGLSVPQLPSERQDVSAHYNEHGGLGNCGT